MADNSKIHDEVKSLTERLETGIQDLYSSDKYRAYLETLSRFHSYSTRNTMLIHIQMPGATQVAGFNKWKKDFERHVMKGQKGIRIMAPAPTVVKKELEVIDPDTQAPMLDKDGKPLLEAVDVTIPKFKPVSVFDVSQTDGKPLPSLAEDLTGNVEQYAAFVDALKDVSVMPISLEPMPSDTDGLCRYDSRTIGIRQDMSEIQTVAAILHEMTHAELHDYNAELDAAEELDEDDEDVEESAATRKPASRRAEEVEAESVSYVVCQHYGIETGENSFGYIASWSKGKELAELKASLEIIRKTATSMIERIDKRFAEIRKERGIELADTSVQPELGELAGPEPSILPELEHVPAAKQYDLGFGHLGNGMSVWNRLEEKAGDYVTVAFIEPDRSIQFFDTELPEEIKAQIEKVARTSDMTVSTTQDNPVFEAPSVLQQQRYELAENIAKRLDDFAQDFDPFGYRDSVDDTEESIRETTRNIADGAETSAYIHEYLQDIASEDGMDSDYVEQAQQLIQSLDDYAGQFYPAPSLSDAEQTKITEDELANTPLAETMEHEDRPEVYEDKPTEETQVTTAAHAVLPDAEIDLAGRDQYGYTDPAILPLLQERARELFDKGCTVYLLHHDGTEEIAFDRFDIEGHGGIFGIESEEWQATEEYALCKEKQEQTELPELPEQTGPVYGKDATYSIYQLKQEDEMRDYRFESLDNLTSHGLAVERDNYNLVYTAPLTDGVTPEGLYTKFNFDSPSDFTGHSLSISDIVVLQNEGVSTAYYVDRFDMAVIPDFLQEKQPPEIDTSIPTVAELEDQVKAGQTISLLDLSRAVQNERSRPADKGRQSEKKPSVLAQLKKAQEDIAKEPEPSQQAPKRDSEREV